MENILLMSVATFLVYVGNYLAPLLVAKGLELFIDLPEWVKTTVSVALGAFFVALVGAIAQLPVIAPYLNQTVLTVILAAVSALITWVASLIGKSQGEYLAVQRLDAQEELQTAKDDR